MSETLSPVPDILGTGLDVLFCGFNPGSRSGRVGHHYAGPGNQFWRLLAAAELTPRLLRPEEDRLLPQWRMGLTNLVGRATPRAEDLSRAEMRAGVPRLGHVVAEARPKMIAYTGKGVYLAATGLAQADWGAQPASLFDGAVDYVVPSPSGLARLPFADKLRWYCGIRDALTPTPGSADRSTGG
ncbi:MAG TPA: mismatch-specific DNA-glycosylase [Azospirillaceae bacterium]|nr:mismatch-specific DNA-glycosylase [Azospirillaceae bacterium]